MDQASDASGLLLATVHADGASRAEDGELLLTATGSATGPVLADVVRAVLSRIGYGVGDRGGAADGKGVGCGGRVEGCEAVDGPGMCRQQRGTSASPAREEARRVRWLLSRPSSLSSATLTRSGRRSGGGERRHRLPPGGDPRRPAYASGHDRPGSGRGRDQARRERTVGRA